MSVCGSSNLYTLVGNMNRADRSLSFVEFPAIILPQSHFPCLVFVSLSLPFPLCAFDAPFVLSLIFLDAVLALYLLFQVVAITSC